MTCELTDSINGQQACRVLRSDTATFVTYTPELFPTFDDLTHVAHHDFTLLFVGETGTGKTSLARFVHELSPRKAKRFLTVACGALPSELIASELFGHVKGSFTGADSTKLGKFDAANGGTILLDEIDVLGLEQQAKLLRVIETGEFEPVGSTETRFVDVRVIATANRNLKEAMKDQFRADLYYRLKQVSFDLPPLRLRPRDIWPLTRSFIDECRQQENIEVREIDPRFQWTVERYSWPGNVRELRNEVRRAVLFCRDGVLSADCLSPSVLEDVQCTAAQRINDQRTGSAPETVLADSMAAAEQERIEHVLRDHSFNRTATAKALGISRVTLYNKINKYDIHIDQQKSGRD